VIVSDPVKLDVAALAELATSIYLPDDVPAGLPITFHSTAKQTNYLSPKGDHTAAVDMPVETTKQSWYSGDHLHPGDAGYRHMGEAFDLSLLK
jgi:hypothetical protein